MTLFRLNRTHRLSQQQMPYVAGQSNFPQFPDGVIKLSVFQAILPRINYTLLVRWLGSRQTTFSNPVFANCMELDAYDYLIRRQTCRRMVNS